MRRRNWVVYSFENNPAEKEIATAKKEYDLVTAQIIETKKEARKTAEDYLERIRNVQEELKEQAKLKENCIQKKKVKEIIIWQRRKGEEETKKILLKEKNNCSPFVLLKYNILLLPFFLLDTTIIFFL